MPDVVEVWQGRASRLQDRCVYRRVGGEEERKGTGMQEAEWKVERLSP